MDIETPPEGFDPGSIEPPPMHEGEWNISSIMPALSEDCNLACRYCAEGFSQPTRQRMSPDMLVKAWHFLYPDGKPKPKTSIRLGNGEPLLTVKLLKQLEALISDSGGSAKEGRPAVAVTTNGVLMKGELKKWLIASGWEIKVSLDGPEDINDKWRVTKDGEGTYKDVSKVVRELARKIPKKLQVLAVMCKGNDPGEVIENITRLGVNSFDFIPVDHRDESILPDSRDVERYESFIWDYADKYIDAEKRDNLPEHVRLKICIQRVMGYATKRIRCGAGRSVVGIGPDGILYPCVRFIGVEDYRLGNLSDGLDKKLLKDFQQGPARPTDKRDPCSKCWAAPICGGPCYSCSELFSLEKGTPIPVHCAYKLVDAKAAVWLVNHLRERDPEVLLSFLPGASDFLTES